MDFLASFYHEWETKGNKDKGKANRREEGRETRRDGECQLPRGHKTQPVSGGGKWQNWVDKLKRTSRILGKPVMLSMAEPPGQRLGGPGFVADFPDLQNHRMLGQKRAGCVWMAAELSAVCVCVCVPSANTQPGRFLSAHAFNCSSLR